MEVGWCWERKLGIQSERGLREAEPISKRRTVTAPRAGLGVGEALALSVCADAIMFAGSSQLQRPCGCGDLRDAGVGASEMSDLEKNTSG